jgi:hypothetical protein
MTTVYASIGNSDDKLTQWAWSDFGSQFVIAIKMHTDRVHGVWYSLPDSRYQNLCACFEINDDAVEGLKLELANLAAQYRQDSIAWAVAETEFIAGEAHRG